MYCRSCARGLAMLPRRRFRRASSGMWCRVGMGGRRGCSGRSGRVAGPSGKGDVARAHASTAHPGVSWRTRSGSGEVPGPPTFTTPTRPLEKNSAPSSFGSPLSATVRRGIRPPVMMRSCGCKPASVVYDEQASRSITRGEARRSCWSSPVGARDNDNSKKSLLLV